MPGAFSRLIWEAAQVRDRNPDDVKWDLKLERPGGGIEVGQEECARYRILGGAGARY